MKSCVDAHDSACPLAFTERSEQIQGYGCLPSPHEIVRMRVEHGRTWACHSDPTKPCTGAIRHLHEQGLPYRVEDRRLVTDRNFAGFRGDMLLIVGENCGVDGEPLEAEVEDNLPAPRG